MSVRGVASLPCLLLFVLVPALAFGQGVTLPAFERVELDNGTVLLLNEQHDVPLVAVSAVLRGGAVSDPRAQYGLAGLFAALLEKGAGERDAAQFAEAVGSAGGRLSAGAGLESITITGDFLARDANLMVGLLADMLLRPAIDAEDPIDDPDILDFVELLDGDGSIVEPGSEAADAAVVTATRRTTLAARAPASSQLLG